jgi:hypothetical protein
MTDFALPGLLLAIAMIYIEIRFFTHLEPSIGILVPSLIMTIYALGIGIFLMRHSGVNWTRLQKIQEEASYRPKDLQELKMIVIRGVDDEASLALAIGSIGARIGRLFLSQVMKVVYFLMTSFTLIGYGVNDTIGFTFGLHTPHWYNIITSILFMIVLTLPIVFRIISGCCKMFFGREFFRNWQHFEIAVGTAPDAYNGIPTTTLPPVSGSTGLRHLIYDHPDCAKAIVNWLIGRS